MNDSEVQEKLEGLEIALSRANINIELLAGALSRYGIQDPNIIEPQSYILERLNRLESK